MRFILNKNEERKEKKRPIKDIDDEAENDQMSLF